MDVGAAGAHESHPSVLNLMLLVFSAILEVVCTSVPGYVLAKMGLFAPNHQKFLAEVNIRLFTPCLSTSTFPISRLPCSPSPKTALTTNDLPVFSKLASQLSVDKLRALAIIPLIFIIQTFISWLSALLVSRICRLKRRPQNFVTAMAVFGNSNSLPISLVLSLSHTLSGLHWSALPNDTDSDVAGRGILYLLIFQQLGQAVRWSWGYHSLLKPKSEYPEYRDEVTEEGGQTGERYTDNDAADNNAQVNGSGGNSGDTTPGRSALGDDLDQYSPAGHTPVGGSSRGSPADSDDEADGLHKPPNSVQNSNPSADGVAFPHTANPHSSPEHFVGTFKAAWMRNVTKAKSSTRRAGHRLYDSLPTPLQRSVDAVEKAVSWTYAFLYKWMNPPLWAMILAMAVASIPALQKLFFSEGIVNNSATTAVKNLGNVAVPLILVVLGANLAGNTQDVESHDQEEAELGTRLLVGSLVARMLLPPLIMGPILALLIKFVPVSMLADPIFVIVNFLLLGAPSALQLAQICQLNEVYERVMAKVLFHSYVTW